MDTLPKLEPLKVRCTDARCDVGLHCFAPNRRKKGWRESFKGACQSCGTELVDWARVRERNLADVAATFAELERELIRHVFFHADFDAKSLEQAHKLGWGGLRAAARAHLARKIGAATIFRDGIQTPKKDSALNFAQHATATCCRKCLHYWHGIQAGHELTVEELAYCEGLVLTYLDWRREDLFPAPKADAPRDGGTASHHGRHTSP